MKSRKLAEPRLVYGVGINDADYVVERREENGYVDGKRKRRLIWFCPYYQTWKNMLQRCYSAKYQDKRPTYKGCTVSEEWLLFSSFRSWMEKQDWEDKQLDKDLLVEGNKVYSEDTCVFVTRMVNTFTIDCSAARGEWLIGVAWNKRASKFESQCRNPFTKKRGHLGLFTCEQEAHEAWLKRKLELAYELAEIQTDSRVAEALINRYSNYKTNTDAKQYIEDTINGG